MTSAFDPETSSQQVILRYWAAARAAAGTDSDVLEIAGPVSLAELVDRARAAHADSSRFSDVLSCCSVMLGDRPVTTADPRVIGTGRHRRVPAAVRRRLRPRNPSGPRAVDPP